MPDEKTQVQKFREAALQLMADREVRDKQGLRIVKTKPDKPE